MHFSALPKAKLTLLRKIQQKKYRYEFQLYMAEGFRLVSEFLVTSPESIEFIIVEENSKYELKHDFVFHLSTTEIKEFAETQHSQGIIAVVKMPKVREIAEILQNAKLIVVCDAVQDPGNLGTIVRNALWFGADALILGEGTVDLYNPKTIRSCMSSLISISIRQLNLNSFFEIAESLGFQTYLFRVTSDSEELNKIEFAEKALLVIGNEGNGIQESLVKPGRTSVIIPDFSKGKTESLNASVASGIALHEYRNQHQKKTLNQNNNLECLEK